MTIKTDASTASSLPIQSLQFPINRELSVERSSRFVAVFPQEHQAVVKLAHAQRERAQPDHFDRNSYDLRRFASQRDLVFHKILRFVPMVACSTIPAIAVLRPDAHGTDRDRAAIMGLLGHDVSRVLC